MPDNDIEKKLQTFVEQEERAENAENAENAANAANEPIITQVAATKLPFQKREEELSMTNKIGWQRIPIEDLPTRGMFYPEGAEIAIRSATAQEIRHWSTLDEENPSTLDDMLNYILERCISYKVNSKTESWKDIKEIDRFYILLATREYTFVQGENQLQVKTSETSTINVRKEMISFLEFDDKLIKHYDPQKRCFSLKFKSGNVIDVSIPSVGLTNFLKHYIERKQTMGQNLDVDFISYAPFVIKDWKGLTDAGYERIAMESNNWGVSEISVLTKLKDLFIDSVNPVVRYNDERGTELTAPLNFRGGIKSVFLISDPFGELV